MNHLEEDTSIDLSMKMETKEESEYRLPPVSRASGSIMPDEDHLAGLKIDPVLMKPSVNSEGPVIRKQVSEDLRSGNLLVPGTDAAVDKCRKVGDFEVSNQCCLLFDTISCYPEKSTIFPHQPYPPRFLPLNR